MSRGDSNRRQRPSSEPLASFLDPLVFALKGAD